MKPSCWKPDIENLYKVLRRETPPRPVLYELFLNARLYQRLSQRPYREGETMLTALQRVVEAFYTAGYDYASASACSMYFPAGSQAHKSTKSLNEGFVITDEASCEAYAWPDPDQFDYSHLENIRLPDGMKLKILGPSGVMENAIALVGYENLCYLQYENPALMHEVINQIGDRLLRYYKNALTFDSVGLIVGNDDWGFNTQTFFSPEAMRTYFIPWHKKIVEAAHAAGRPAILHSCGNLDAVMEDVIQIGYDAKHSYEDNIIPVEAAYDKWKDRIAILGGIDVGFILLNDDEAIKSRCRRMLEKTSETGGYALGTGNSVPDYMPDEKYFAMLSAAYEF